MKKVLFIICIVLALAITIFGCTILCDRIMDSAAAEESNSNLLLVKDPLTWNYSNVTTTSSFEELANTFVMPSNSRYGQAVYWGASSGESSTLNNNTLTCSSTGELGKFSFLLFYVKTSDLVSQGLPYGTYYCTFDLADLNGFAVFYFQKTSRIGGAITNVFTSSGIWANGRQRFSFSFGADFPEYLVLRLHIYGSATLNGISFNNLSTFTGYYYSNNDFSFADGYDVGYSFGHDAGFDEGLDLGYAQGFMEGVEQYARRVETYSFNNVEHPMYTDVGLTALGITSLAELEGSFFSMSSYWFQSQGYTVLSSGTIPLIDLDDNPILGVSLYISTVTNFDPLTTPLDGSVPTIRLTILENRSYLDIYDNNFPSNWNPVEYPYARVVTVSAQLGVSAFMEQMQAASETIGYNRGFEAGRSEGYEYGRQAGYEYGVTVANSGSWRSFLSALIGVPVSYITSFFDFEIFGFNFLTVFKFVVTVSMLVFIVKALLGKVTA